MHALPAHALSLCEYYDLKGLTSHGPSRAVLRVRQFTDHYFSLTTTQTFVDGKFCWLRDITLCYETSHCCLKGHAHMWWAFFTRGLCCACSEFKFKFRTKPMETYPEPWSLCLTLAGGGIAACLGLGCQARKASVPHLGWPNQTWAALTSSGNNTSRQNVSQQNVCRKKVSALSWSA